MVVLNSPLWTIPIRTLSSGFGFRKSKSDIGMEKSIYTREYAVILRLLRHARDRAGMTQVELAKKLHQSQSFVSKVERGDRRLDLVQLRAICKVLDLTLSDFVQQFERELSN